ncbi:hypothetical protein M3Y98_00346700 [Aphelenchoides besseyi]|nr:hypothetical protein M3Y98_00346700 [Aphelenchoides besseyi]KAI6201592.1 hypothetical protein M3Y96_00858600 [Aphelenchoides besseyi]
MNGKLWLPLVLFKRMPKTLKQARCSHLTVILLVFLIEKGHSIRVADMSQCIVKSAEGCFEKLFENMPICTELELTFRCHHFKVLDSCFREHRTMCSPATIGQIAKAAYRHKVVLCARQAQKKYRDASSLKKTPTILKSHPPTELQFISLFGYLQTQCSTRPNENCTNEDFSNMITSCESGIRQRGHLTNSDLERHQLLRIKLDASSRLLPFPETRRLDECLIIRSALSEIFMIHQKYCLQTILTRCMCERLNFEYFCDIECANLEPSGLPFYQQVSWDEFKGRLVGSDQLKVRANFITLTTIAFCMSWLLDVY